MKAVFVAGPFTAINGWLVEKNIRVAEKAAMEIAKMGVLALCPHTQSRYMHGTLTEEYWIKATLEMLSRCDAMYVCPDWVSSVGTKGEIKYALASLIPLFYCLSQLEVWISAADPKSAADAER